MSDTLEEKFLVCPECSASWRQHWSYVWEGGERKSKYNTCGYTHDQLETKWLHEETRAP